MSSGFSVLQASLRAVQVRVWGMKKKLLLGVVFVSVSVLSLQATEPTLTIIQEIDILVE